MDTLTTADGLKLHLLCWPAEGAERGTVQIVHGLGEHIGRYGAVAAQLTAAGWRVVGHDHRGHGRSEGPRGAIPDSQSLLADLAAVTDRLRRPGVHVLLGHSLGGLVASRFVAEALAPRPAAWSRAVDGLVLSSPALQTAMSVAQRILLAVLGATAPSLALGNGLDPSWVSRDLDVVRDYVADPLNHDRITPRLAGFVVDGGEVVRGRASLWSVPTLLMWAGADRCVAPAGSAAFAAAAPAGVLTAREFPGLFHEIFNEPEQAEVLSQLLRWLARF